MRRANERSITKNNMDDESIRAAWKTGSRCQIYSKSAKQWFLGEVTRTFLDEQGEWLEVRYNQSTLKQVQRSSEDIRPLVSASNVYT